MSTRLLTENTETPFAELSKLKLVRFATKLLNAAMLSTPARTTPVSGLKVIPVEVKVSVPPIAMEPVIGVADAIDAEAISIAHRARSFVILFNGPPKDSAGSGLLMQRSQMPMASDPYCVMTAYLHLENHIGLNVFNGLH